MFYDENSKCSSDKNRCWKNFDPKNFNNNSYPIENIYSQSADSFFVKEKYSRIINDIDIYNLKSAKIGEINNLNYNFFWPNDYDLVRENIPFFVMYEVPSLLINSTICWEGNIFWENCFKNGQNRGHRPTNNGGFFFPSPKNSAPKNK